MTACRRIIVTSDPGQDQAVAILLILGSQEEFEVLGIVATAGNIGLEHTERNTRKILELAGRIDIPVFLGSPRPLRRELVTAAHVHGPTGLDGPALPEPTMKLQTKPGVDFIIETLLAEPPGTVTVVSLSPLTNLALALRKAPEIAGRIREIAMMAGAYFEVGNITPSAEFNVYVDPEAADVVLRSGVPITMLPLDVTHRMLSTPARLNRIHALGNRSGVAVAEMLRFSERFDLEKYGWPGAPLHGPCVPAYMIRPDLFQGRNINVTVETESALTLGMTVADWWRITEQPRNVFYVRDGDVEGYYDLLTERLARLP
jgi:purine nucleosidase